MTDREMLREIIQKISQRHAFAHMMSCKYGTDYWDHKQDEMFRVYKDVEGVVGKDLYEELAKEETRDAQEVP